MKLAISNIVWSKEESDLYKLMGKYNFTGLEIAPTKIFTENPYEKLIEGEKWQKKLIDEYNIKLVSMQSIWFGKTENIFNSIEEREVLADYTKKAIDFAQKTKCGNLVFGCPKNRVIGDNLKKESAEEFFREIGEYAFEHNTCIGMEANPSIYGTNFINNTKDAIDLVKKINNPGYKLNLDVGTMIVNDEKVSELEGVAKYINHIHISEPYLKPIEQRQIHIDLIRLLNKEKYDGYISIEMATHEDEKLIEEKMYYLSKLIKDII